MNLCQAVLVNHGGPTLAFPVHVHPKMYCQAEDFWEDFYHMIFSPIPTYCSVLHIDQQCREECHLSHHDSRDNYCTSSLRPDLSSQSLNNSSLYPCTIQEP